MQPGKMNFANAIRCVSECTWQTLLPGREVMHWPLVERNEEAIEALRKALAGES